MSITALVEELAAGISVDQLRREGYNESDILIAVEECALRPLRRRIKEIKLSMLDAQRQLNALRAQSKVHVSKIHEIKLRRAVTPGAYSDTLLE